MTKRYLFSFRAVRCDLARQCKGVTAVEMALLAPVFFLLLLGTMEMALIGVAQQLLENATYNTSRLAKTGYTTTGQTQMQTVTDVLNQELQSYGSLIDTNHVTMTSMSYTSFSNVGTGGTAGIGNAQQIVVYSVSYPWKIFTPVLGAMIGDPNGNIILTSQIVVRNEPY